MLACFGCEWRLRPTEQTVAERVVVERFDRIETLFLTTGDVSALQQMYTNYPRQTRTLIEDLLQVGHVNDSDINARFHHYFQDTTLQRLIADASQRYADMNDVGEELTLAFERLRSWLPSLPMPQVYAQIGSLDQSIVVGDGMLGISLDKYLGSDYPLYLKYGYTERQRSMMTRSFIVPDCLGFYLLSVYPQPGGEQASRQQLDQHMGCIQYCVNFATGQPTFKNAHVDRAGQLMNEQHLTAEELLRRY
ncbi:MAG: gliding motility protein GldB [Prevotella sp.]|nr:gliding motility protein GldB [Prevotella sp.]